MSRTLSFIMTGPPTLDAGTFVSIIDDETGARLDGEIGWWWHDGTYHRFSMPYEFAPRLVTPPPAASIADTIKRAEGGSKELGNLIAESDAILARKKLRERVDGASRKSAESPAPAAAAASAPAHWETCPSCRGKFDPGAHELMDCGNCGESKCTAACLPNPVSPCLDCQALDGAAAENEQVAAPPSGALFDGKFRGKEGAAGSELADEETD